MNELFYNGIFDKEEHDRRLSEAAAMAFAVRYYDYPETHARTIKGMGPRITDPRQINLFKFLTGQIPESELTEINKERWKSIKRSLESERKYDAKLMKEVRARDAAAKAYNKVIRGKL